MVPLGDVVKWKLGLVCLEIVLISSKTGARFASTLGSEIALGTPDGAPRWRRSSGRSF
jgi:hypothetical protein